MGVACVIVKVEKRSVPYNDGYIKKVNEFIIISILAVGVVIAIYVKSLKLQKQCYKLENLSINKILTQSNTYKGRTIAIKPAEIDVGDGGTIKSYSIIMNLKQKCEVSFFDKLKYFFSLYYGNIDTYSITGHFPPWPKDPTNEKHTLQILDKMTEIADYIENKNRTKQSIGL